MTVVEKVIHAIQKYNLIAKDDNVIVGLSGGPDSVCLLHVLNDLSERMQIHMFAVHINHMLRGQEADEDEKYVRELCKRLDIELIIKVHDIKEISKQRGLSLEEAGREVRYKEFETLALRLGQAKIAVAHNKNDQAETLLMRIIRGTGIDGLKGMNHIRNSIIRPLLDVERNEIEQYCSCHQLFPRIDSSNLENVYTRNRIRLDLIPYINEVFNTDIVDSLYKMSLLLRDDYNFIEQSMEEIYNDCIVECHKSEMVLKLSKLQRLHSGALKRVLRHALMQVKGDLKGIENVHIESCMELIHSGRTGAILHLPHGIRVGRSYDAIKVFSEVEKFKGCKVFVDVDAALRIPGITDADRFEASVEATFVDAIEDYKQYRSAASDSLQQFFDYEKLKEGINIRSRRNGDVFKPLKSLGTKKLKEYFIDHKIPRDTRDKIPVVAKNNEIVWLVGFKISDKFKVTENTKCVLKLNYKKKEKS